MGYMGIIFHHTCTAPACTGERPCDSPRAAVAGAVPRGTLGGREPDAAVGHCGALLLLLLLLLPEPAAAAASAPPVTAVLVAFADALAARFWSAERGCCARCPSPSRTCWKVRYSSEKTARARIRFDDEFATQPPRHPSVS